MLKKNGDINWVETLAQIASEKGNQFLAEYIRGFEPIPHPSTVIHYTTPEATQTISTMTPANTVDYSGLSDNFAKPSNVHITRMPEATCDGCQ